MEHRRRTRENAVAGWGGYQKPKKTKEQIAAERRRELGAKYFSDIDELIAIAAKCRMKPKKLPPAPHPDDDLQAPPESLVGPCQSHVAAFRAMRAAKAEDVVLQRLARAGSAAPVAEPEAPYVDPITARLAAQRAYYKKRRPPPKAVKPAPKGTRSVLKRRKHYV
jgi:hypothetical protein